MTSLVGREPELRVLHELVDVLVATAPGPLTTALVVVGDTGIGKTALLDATAEHAHLTGVRLLRADGCRAEADVPFAALSQLLGEVAHLVADLPERQGRAVGTVLDLDVPPPSELSALHAGVHRMLRALATDGPVLLLVDDADRLDLPSLHALLFVARRLTIRDRVGVVLAGRGERRPLPGDAPVPTLALAPLARPAAETLLERLPDPPTGRAREEILDAAAGNPLALVDLAEAGTDRPLAIRGRAAALFADRVRQLPGPTRRLLLHAAAGEGESTATIGAAAGETGLAGWAPAERDGLVTVDGDHVVFRHPLARAAVYAVATGEERRAAHLALAGAGDEPHRIAWHHAHAGAGPDEDVAAALAATADRALARGAHREAARAWERAAECSPDPAARVARHHHALRAAYAAGDARWVADQHRVIRELTEDPTIRVLSTLLQAATLMMRARYQDAWRVMQEVAPLLGAVDAPGVVLLAAFLAVAADESGTPGHRAAAEEILRHPAVVRASGEVSAGAVSPADLVWLRGVVGADRSSAAAALDEALRAGRAGPGASADDLHNLGLLADRADDVRRAIDLLTRSLDLMHHEGPAAWGAGALVTLLIEHGRWTTADEVVVTLGASAENRRVDRLAVEVAASRATLLAQRGDPAAAQEVLAAARSRVDLADNLLLDLRLRSAAAVAATVEGDHPQAYRDLRGAFTVDGEPRHAILSPRLVARLAAAAGPQERDDAAVVVGRVREAVGERTSARMRLLLHHADALVGSEQDTEHHFRLALADPTGEDWPVERATVRLHYGEWLRRRRRTLEARDMLTAALEAFDVLGAVALAERVRAELRAAGSAEHVEVESEADPLAGLTPQQREIVRLAAQGLRNREIGERLYLSPRTVGSHLHHAYPKLGISGRHQLGSLLRTV